MPVTLYENLKTKDANPHFQQRQFLPLTRQYFAITRVMLID